MIKKNSISLLFVLPLVAPLSVNAGIKGMTEPTNSEHLKATSNAAPTYIHNNTTMNLAYRIHGSTVFNSVYGVGSKSLDTYHAGNGDDFAYIEVSICDSFEFPDKCASYGSLRSCVNNYYDIYKVSDISINQDMTCTVRCRMVSETSCKK